MNIFVLDENPVKSAQAMDCVRVPKMVTESAQMMASALRRWGATDEQMPLTKSGSPYKGGYHFHPCTIFAGDTRANFKWLAHHAEALLDEYYHRFGKVHACHNPIYQMSSMSKMIPEGDLMPFAQAMPDEFKHEDAVQAYRAYYHSKTFAKWEKGTPAPDWWMGVSSR